MKTTSRHIIRKSHKYYRQLKRACVISAKIRNVLIGYIEGEYKKGKKVSINVASLYSFIKYRKIYRKLPGSMAIQTIKHFVEEYKSYFKALKKYKVAPHLFKSQPEKPNFKKSRNGYIIGMQNLSEKELSEHYILVPDKDKKLGSSIRIGCHVEGNVDHVRILPRRNYLVMELVSEEDYEKSLNLDYTKYCGIDMGVPNFATLAFSDPEFEPMIYDGKRGVKKINQFYNKRKAYYTSKLGKFKNGKQKKKSNRLSLIDLKRDNKMRDQMHKISTDIINFLKYNGIGNLVIGKNDGWKQDVNMGRKANQSFCYIPHAKFIEMLKYKAEREGIKVEVITEEYTSKCSFLDLEPIQHHNTYAGVRYGRLFKSSNGTIINADVNGAYNIIRKKHGNLFNINNVLSFPIVPKKVYVE